MGRHTTYLLLFALVGVFVFFAPPENQFLVILGALLSVILAVSGFYLNWLTLDGVPAATLVGTVSFGLGGLPMAGLLLIFFLSSSLISGLPLFRGDPPAPASAEREERLRRRPPGREGRRTGSQVWANGFWLVLCLLLLHVTGEHLFTASAVAALAAATSDTWSTELGTHRMPGNTWSLTSLRPVPAGSDGGISLPGTLAGVAGSALLAGAGTWFYSLNLVWFFIIFSSGFLGCLFDSLLGATSQDSLTLEFPMPFTERPWSLGIDNNTVNWLATGFASLWALILNGIYL
ncbi:MAG: DUF92 domain-containing protein [Balneolaceae bacterium]|nr:DUF92 domain-containing protein [Balneolaceae bacterium]